MPPHNLEAEESVLGAVMLSSDAANAVMDKLNPEDFYVPAHQAIFESITQLYNGNQPIDVVTVSDVLRRSEELDRVGGVVYLTELMERVPTASNVDYYSNIVEEHAMRRNLLQAGARITDFALQTDEEIIDVLDNAEQTVLGVAERRVGDGLQPIAPMLQSTLEVIEELEATGDAITGLATGYRDLDSKLAGLHPANLLIVAARPSMGKCLVGSTRVVDPKTGALVTIQSMVEDVDGRGTQHVLAFDRNSAELVVASPSGWADNGVRDVFRVRTRLGRTITATANHPLLTWEGWKPVGELAVGSPIAVAGRVDVFGVDVLPDAEVALLGLLIGDGTLTGSGPKFTTASPILLGELERIASELGMQVTGHKDESLTYRIVRPSDRPSQEDVAAIAGVSSATVSLALAGKPGPSVQTRDSVRSAAEELGYRNEGAQPPNALVGLLERHGIWGSVAATKHVPDAVFRLPKRQVALFLSRLYATDGSAWVSGGSYRIEYVTVSERLADDVQHLLLRFGIVAKLRRRDVRYKGSTRIAFEVAVQDPLSVRRFATEIGILSKEEQLARVVAAAESRGSDRAFSELLPIEAWELILRAKGEMSWADVSARTGRPRNHNWHVGTRRPSRRIAAELANVLDDENLRSISGSDVVWDDIVSIEPAGKQRTYDIEVPYYSNFVADDVVAHNSTLALNIASNVAMDGGTVAVFSLEMSKEEIIQRMLCSVGRVDSMALRTGQLDARGWQRVVNAASKMYPAPVFVDDSASVTVTDIRAKSRRLKRQHGLSLIVVDYLQLMQGRNRENRQQEIAEISRNLKNLARELEVPIIAASQLNRGLEAREDKRPRLGDLRECLTADTQVRRSDTGGTISIGEIARERLRNVPVWSVDSQLELVPATMTEAWSTGEKPVFRVTTRSGRVIRATGNHPLLTFEGWMPVAALEPGSRIAVPRRLESPSQRADWTDDELIVLAHLIGDGSYLRKQPLRYASGDSENIEVVRQAATRRFNVAPIVDHLPDGSYSLRLRAAEKLGHGRRNPICEWLDDLGVFDQRSHQKRLPQSLFSATDTQLRLFLHHLWATDGSITVRPDDSRGRIFYGSNSRRLAQDVYVLLLRLGLQPRLTSSNQGQHLPMWNVDISGSDQQKKFLDEVSAFGKRGDKGRRLAEVLRGRVANTNVDTIPRGFWSQAKASMAAQGITHRELYERLNSKPGGTAVFKVAPSRRRAGIVATVLQDVDLARHAATDILWDEIKSIEPDGVEETFDARVESTHNFVADEIVVHNSGAIEQDADIVLFIYRHEYYYPDDPESKGLAEIIVSKHRAGATGKVDMTFLPRYTLFADVGRDAGL